MAINEVYFEDMGNGEYGVFGVSDLADEYEAADEVDSLIAGVGELMNSWVNKAVAADVPAVEINDVLNKIVKFYTGSILGDLNLLFDFGRDWHDVSVDEWKEWAAWH